MNTANTRFILFRIADAIESNRIIVGERCSVGRYQAATGDDATFHIIPANGSIPDVQFTDSINAAYRFIQLEGESSAARAALA